MKKVFIVQTPYQLIVSLMIKQQFCNKLDQLDLIITDTFSNYDKVSEKINNLNIFSNVYIVKLKDSLLPQKRKINNLKKLYYILHPKKMVKKYLENIDDYDEMYCWNYDAFTANLRSYFSFIDKNIKVYLFEDGYVSYLPIDEVIPKRGFLKIIETRNKICGKRNITRENIDGLFLLDPSLLIYTPNFEIFKIDRSLIKTKEFKNMIDSIFNVRKSLKDYDRKYIIFEEYHPEYNDEEVFKKIIEIVGKENVLIKLHPRRTENRFKELGIKTLGSDGVPFEALALTNDFSNNVLISIGSGSVISYRMLFGNDMHGYLLFKFAGSNLKQFEKKYMEFWDNLESKDFDKGIHMPNSINQFIEMIKKEGENDNK